MFMLAVSKVTVPMAKGRPHGPVAMLRTVTGLMESLLKHLQSEKEGKGSLAPVY